MGAARRKTPGDVLRISINPHHGNASTLPNRKLVPFPAKKAMRPLRGRTCEPHPTTGGPPQRGREAQADTPPRPSSSKAVSHAGPENPDQLDSAHAPGGLLGRQAERRDVIVDKRGGTRQAAIRANRGGQSGWQAERTRGLDRL